MKLERNTDIKRGDFTVADTLPVQARGSTIVSTSVFLVHMPAMNTDVDKRQNVILSIREVGVVSLELNRPLKRNALSQDLIDELTGVLVQLDRDSTVRAVILTSVGESPFCGEWNRA